MSKTSSKVKDRWNKKAYDSILWRVPKGKKEYYKEEANKRNLSVNAFITECVEKEISKDS